MKHAPVHNKATQQSASVSLPRPVTGSQGIAIAPPTYGVEFIDRQHTDSDASSINNNNGTGLPDHLKVGIEFLSGIALDNVHVHYNSPKPATLQSLAYTQGMDIHVAPGQEQHLPHEAWHVMQQAQGRVKPTMQLKDGMPVNDDRGLEYEADVMGAKAMQMRRPDQVATGPSAQATTAEQRTGETTEASDVQGTKSGTSEEKVRLNFLYTAPGNNLAVQQRSRSTIQRLKGTAAVNATQDSFMRNLQFVSGHGAFNPTALRQKELREKVRVPSNTTLTFWLPHGGGLNDWAGQQVETGGNFANLIDLYKEKNLALEVYEPYNEVPNYTLTPGKDLTMVQQPGSKSFIADRTYTLEDLMDKFKGRNIHWVACRTVSNTMTADELWGAAKGNREDREELGYAKKTLWSGHKNKEHFNEQMNTLGATVIGDVKKRGQKVGPDVKSMDIDEMKAAIRDTLAQSPSKPNIFEAFGAYSIEYQPGGESKVKSEYKEIQQKIETIETAFRELNEQAAANNTTPAGLIQQLRGKLARLGNEMQIEEQKQGDTRDEDKIANLEDEIFECESEIRLHEATTNEHQTIERLKNQDRIKKQKYIKTQVHDQAWQDRWR